MAESCWVAHAPPTHYPALRNERAFDVVFVGGGIVGLTAAIELARTGRSVALTEAMHVGRQVIGRSTAKITTQYGLIYRYLIDKFGRDAARLYAEANARGCTWIRDAVGRHGIACDLKTAAAFVYIDASRGRQRELESEAEAALSLGPPADVVDRVPLPFPTSGALRFSGQAMFNPALYLIGLAAAARQAGVEIFEQSRVTSVDQDNRWTVRCKDGHCTGRDVLLATHIPVAGDDDFTGRMQPRCHTAMAFAIDPQDAPKGMFIGVDEPTHSIRRGRDGNRILLVVLGSRFETGHEGMLHGASANWRTGHARISWLATLAGAGLTRITRRQTACHSSALPTNRGSSLPQDSMPGASATGQQAASSSPIRLVAGPTTGHCSYDPNRSSAGDVNKGGKSASVAKRVEDIAVGQGGIIEASSDKLAVWRDDAGALHAVAAACTHQGCTVTWYNVDQTWDCPCHGSVFAVDATSFTDRLSTRSSRVKCQRPNKPAGSFRAADPGKAIHMADNPKSTAQIDEHPIHPMLIPFPIAFFVAAFATDLAFWWTRNSAWSDAGIWLLGAGLVMAALAALAGLTDFMGEARIRALSDAWHHMFGNVLAVLIELGSFVMRYRSGADAILPTGLMLSLIVVLILLYTGWKGWEMVYRHRVGVSDTEPDSIDRTRSPRPESHVTH